MTDLSLNGRALDVLLLAVVVAGERVQCLRDGRAPRQPLCQAALPRVPRGLEEGGRAALWSLESVTAPGDGWGIISLSHIGKTFT